MAAGKGILDEDALNIWTDGSSVPSGPRRGGIGVVFVTVDDQGEEVVDVQDLGGYPGATNNEMELLAAIEGLRIADDEGRVAGYHRIAIHTDSMYVRDNHKRALYEWSRSKWRNRSGRPIENADLWKALVREIKKQAAAGRRVDIRWTKAHKSDPHNKAADKAAKTSRENILNKPLRRSGLRRKTTSESTEVGSIRMEGQELIVRIVEANWMRAQRTNRYRIEVLSEDSPYCGKMDFVFWDTYLREGHHYLIRLNRDQGNPKIAECISEIDRE